jgi:Neurotransmitter-gated ion-channel transmembrane region
LKVKPDGTVYYKERFHGLFNSETNLKKFPFDSQQLKLILESPLDDSKNIVLAVDRNKNGKSKRAFLPGWEIGSARAFVNNNYLEVDGWYYPEFVYEIELSRLSGAYVWNVFAPLLLIVIIAWLVFWSKSFEANCGISVSCLLSAIAFHIVIAEELPKVSYLTFINGFILLSYIFIALSIVQIVVKHRLELEKKHELSIAIDRGSRWLFPTLFGLSNLVLIVIFLL